jgi:hypothetical protein
MTLYYPQVAVELRILFEDFGKGDPLTAREQRLSVTPKSATVSINDYTRADTFRLELDYKNFPFDPRTLRSVGVQIHMEDMKNLLNATGEPNFIKPSEDNAVFLGFVDTDELRFDENSRSVSMEGRDFTGLFIDSPYRDPEPLSINQPLDIILQSLVRGLKATAKMSVELRGLTSLPNLGALATDYSPLTGYRNKKKNETYWDVIQDLADLAGVIIFVELDRLIVTKPNALYDRKKSKQFVWGKNLSTLEFQRKLGRLRYFNVHVKSLNPANKYNAIIEARIPLQATQEWSTRTGVPLKEVQIEKVSANKQSNEIIKEPAPYFTFRLANISDQAHLIQVGELIYEEIGRQQIEGRFTTKDMGTWEGESKPSAKEFNLLKLRNGSPLDIKIYQDDLDAISREKSPAARVNYLQNRGYSRAVAQAFALTLGKFTTPFYTKAVEFTMNADTGFQMDVDFINFIELSENLGIA